MSSRNRSLTAREQIEIVDQGQTQTQGLCTLCLWERRLGVNGNGEVGLDGSGWVEKGGMVRDGTGRDRVEGREGYPGWNRDTGRVSFL